MTQKLLKTIRIGLIGYGFHGQGAVVPAMRKSREIELVAVADLNPANLEKLVDLRVARYMDYRPMLERERLDAVYIASRVESHCEMAIAAFKAGLHVITEKPMAVSIQQCRRMIATAEKAKRLLVVDFESRYIPEFRQIRKWIAEGRLGRIHAIHVDEMWDGHKIWGGLGERRRRFLNSSGCLDCGIHKLDLVRYFCGGGRWQDIQAYGAWFGERVKHPSHISIMARLDNRVLVTLNASMAFTAYIPKRMAGNCVYGGLAILGDKGVIVLHRGTDGKEFIELLSQSLERTIPFKAHSHASVIPDLLADAAESMRKRRPLPPELATGYDGLMAQMCVDQANRSAIQNKVRG